MLMVFLLAGQIMLLGYQKQLLQDAAIEAAMFGALADQSSAAAESKAQELFMGSVAEVTAVGETLKLKLSFDSLIGIEVVGIAVLENAVR